MDRPEDDFYSREEILERAENDAISSTEEGVMLGYLTDTECCMDEDWEITG